MTTTMPQAVSGLGLLSRPAGSAGFSTDAFLSSIQSDVEVGMIPSERKTGTLLFPRVSDGRLVAEPLTDERISEAKATIAQFVKEARAIATATGAHALPATEGRWTLYRGRMENRFFLRSTSGRYVDIGDYRDDAADIGVTGSGRYATYNHYVAIKRERDGGNHVSTAQFWMMHRGDRGLSALAEYLNLPKPSMSAFALELTNRIYASSQYAARELEWTLIASLGGRRDVRLVPAAEQADVRQWRFPEAFVDDGAGPIIDIATERDRDGAPYAYVSAIVDDEIGPEAIVALGRSRYAPQPLMPLSPELQPLFESARRLVTLDPDDGGYMVKDLRELLR